MSLVSIVIISCLHLASVAEQASFELYLVVNPEDMFSCDMAQILMGKILGLSKLMTLFQSALIRLCLMFS